MKKTGKGGKAPMTMKEFEKSAADKRVDKKELVRINKKREARK